MQELGLRGSDQSSISVNAELPPTRANLQGQNGAAAASGEPQELNKGKYPLMTIGEGEFRTHIQSRPDDVAAPPFSVQHEKVCGDDVGQLDLKALPPAPGQQNAWVKLSSIASQPGHHLLVARTHDACGRQQAVGYCLYSRNSVRAIVVRLGVDQASRRQGIAWALLLEMCMQLRKKRCACASLHVNHTNSAAISLYSKLGFEPKQKVKGYYSGGAAAIVMALEDILSRESFDHPTRRRCAVSAGAVYQ